MSVGGNPNINIPDWCLACLFSHSFPAGCNRWMDIWFYPGMDFFTPREAGGELARNPEFG
jgi:hypothetical protein